MFSFLIGSNYYNQLYRELLIDILISHVLTNGLLWCFVFTLRKNNWTLDQTLRIALPVCDHELYDLPIAGVMPVVIKGVPVGRSEDCVDVDGTIHECAEDGTTTPVIFLNIWQANVPIYWTLCLHYDRPVTKDAGTISSMAVIKPCANSSDTQKKKTNLSTSCRIAHLWVPVA